MAEVESESVLNSCLKLLKGEEDEKKTAGLLMAAKYLKPTVLLFYANY